MILWFLAGLVLLVALLLVRKVRRDAIRQDGRAVGSALGWLVAPDGVHARFAIIRGEAAFRDDQAFEYQGQAFLIVGYDSVDDRSRVLRRYLDVTCWMVPPGQPGQPPDPGRRGEAERQGP